MNATAKSTKKNGELVLCKNACLTPVGIQWSKRELTESQWEEIGDTLVRIDQASQFWIGDWLERSDVWGNKYTEAAELLDKPEKTLEHYAYVSRNVQISIRMENLKWAHHQLVASLDESEQVYWLGRAVNHNLTVKELREAIKAAKDKTWYTIPEWESMGDQAWEDILNHKSDTQFNKQDTTSIEWPQWSWNPITGCKHDCPYCYARDIANRFYPQKFEPAIYPSRLWAPVNTTVPSKAESEFDPPIYNIRKQQTAFTFFGLLPEPALVRPDHSSAGCAVTSVSPVHATSMSFSTRSSSSSVNCVIRPLALNCWMISIDSSNASTAVEFANPNSIKQAPRRTGLRLGSAIGHTPFASNAA